MRNFLHRFCWATVLGMAIWLAPHPARAQSSYQFTYGQVGSNEAAADIALAADGNLVLAGYTDENGTEDLLVLKLDITTGTANLGNVIWQRAIDLGGAERATALIETADGGYVVVGERVAGGNRDIVVVKLDINGNTVFSTAFDNGGNDDFAPYDAVYENGDGTLLILGASENPTGVCGGAGIACQDAFVAKLTATGVVAWQQRYTLSGSARDYAAGAIERPTGYVIFGSELEGIAGGFYIEVDKTNGALLANPRINVTLANPIQITSVQEGATPNEAIIGGFYLNPATFNNDIYGAALNITGTGAPTTIVRMAMGGPASFETNPQFRRLPNGEYGLVGFSDQQDMLVGRFNAAGIQQWANRYGSAGLDSAAAIVGNAAGEAYIAGFSAGFGPDRDVYLLKLNASGNTPCNTVGTLNNQALPNLIFPPILAANAAVLNNLAAVANNLPAATVNNNPCCIGFAGDYSTAPPAICEGEPLTLQLDEANGSTDLRFTIAWNSGDPDAVVDGPGGIAVPPGYTNLPLSIPQISVVDTLTLCTDVDNFDLSPFITPLPTPNAGPDRFICDGDTALLNWVPLGAPAIETFAGPGTIVAPNPTLPPPQRVVPPAVGGPFTYTLTAVVNGCVGTDDVNVTVNPLPTADAGPDQTVCLGDNAILDATGSASPTPPLGYSWESLNVPTNPNPSPATVATPTVTAPGVTGEYALTVTDGNTCVNRDTVQVAVVNISLSSGADTSYCTNTGGVTLDATVTGAAGCVYNWFLGDLGGNPPNLPTQTVAPAFNQPYAVAVNCGGCTDTDTVIVNVTAPPTVNAGNDTTFCAGTSVVLTASSLTPGLSYQWQPLGAGGFNGPTNMAMAEANAADVYQVVGTDPATGCSDTDEVQVTETAIPTVGLPLGPSICEGDTTFRLPAVSVDVVAYLWSPAAQLANPGDATLQSPGLAPSDTTTFVLRVFNAAGCSDSDSVTVNVVPNPTAAINGVQMGDTTVCQLDTVVLNGSLQDGSAPDTYQWFVQPNGTGPRFALPGGQMIDVVQTDTLCYYLSVTRGGCASSFGDTAQYCVNYEPRVSAEFTVPFEVCEGEPVELVFLGPYTPSQATSYDNLVWDFGNGAQISGTPFGDTVSVIWNQLGLDTVTLTNFGPFCTSVDEAEINVLSIPVASAGPDTVMCAGDSYVLKGAFTNASDTIGLGVSCFVQWTPGTGLNNPFALNPVASPSTTTTYGFVVNCGGCVSDTDFVTVSVNDIPFVELDTFLIDYCQGASAVVNAQAFGGTGGPYNLSWERIPVPPAGPPAPDVTPSNLNGVTTGAFTFFADSTVQYILRATDQNTGCTSPPDFLTVVVNESPVVDAGPDTAICEGTGAGVFLQGQLISGGFGLPQVTWSPSVSLSDSTTLTPYATPDVTTIYRLSVVNTFSGCANDPLTDESSVTVSLKPRPVVNVGATGVVDTFSVCPGGQTQLSATPSGAGPNYTYAWTPTGSIVGPTSGQVATVAPTTNTTYFVKAFSNGCESVADTAVVIVNPQPVSPITSNYEQICLGDSVQLGSISPDPAYTYQWSPLTGLDFPNSPNPTASPTTSTTYSVVVFSTIGGCASPDTDTVRVEVAPTPEALLASTVYNLCSDAEDSVQLLVNNVVTSLTPVIFTWSPNIAISDVSAQSPFVKPSTSTTYTLTLQAGQCISSAEVDVFVTTGLGAAISLDGANTLCAGDARTLTATGGVGSASFVWLDNGLTAPVRTVNPVSDTTYTVALAEGPCVDTASVELFVTPQPEAAFEFGYSSGCDDALGDGFEVAFTATDEDVYFWSWDFGDGTPPSNLPNPVHVYDLPGGSTGPTTYTVTLRVAALGACDSAISQQDVVLVEPQGNAAFATTPASGEIFYLPEATVVFEDQSLNAQQWFWEFGDGFTSTEANPVHTYEQPGTYTPRLTITDAAGCTHSAVLGPFTVRPTEFDFMTVFTPNGDGFNDEWRINYQGNANYTLLIQDRNGRLMYEGRRGENPWRGEDPSGNEAPAGVYFYVLQVGDRVYKGNFTLLR